MGRMLVAFWVGVISAFGTTAHAAETSTSDGTPVFKTEFAAKSDARFERQLTAIAATDHIVGLAVAVVRDGQPTLIRTYGPREMGGSEAVNSRTVFRLASVSKGFSTALVAQLIAEGNLKLTDSTASYSPKFRLRDRSQIDAVTLEYVMSHRVGLPPHAYDNLLEAGVSPARILHRLGGLKLACPVGQCYAYQNVAFNMLTDVIEAADGRRIGEAMAGRIFEPLRMGTASVGPEGLRRSGNWARPHRRRKGEPWRVLAARKTWYRLPAAAGVNASITDMVHWLAAQMGNAPMVLSEEMLSMLHKPRVETPSQIRRYRHYLTIDSAHYGLGWRIYKYRGETVVSHTGSVDGYAAQITFLPARKTGIVALTNSRSAMFYTIVPAWLNMELERSSPSKQASLASAPGP